MSEERKPEIRGPQAAEADERTDPSVNRAPDYKAQYGRVQAAVWTRDVEGRTAYSVSLTRSYKDRHEQWQRTTALDEEDLLPAAKSLDDVYTWIQRQRQHSRAEALHELHVPPRAANS